MINDISKWPETANLSTWTKVLGINRNSLHRRIKLGDLKATKRRIHPIRQVHQTFIDKADIIACFDIKAKEVAKAND
jgi:hypothetical protein